MNLQGLCIESRELSSSTSGGIAYLLTLRCFLNIIIKSFQILPTSRQQFFAQAVPVHPDPPAPAHDPYVDQQEAAQRRAQHPPAQPTIPSPPGQLSRRDDRTTFFFSR